MVFSETVPVPWRIVSLCVHTLRTAFLLCCHLSCREGQKSVVHYRSVQVWAHTHECPYLECSVHLWPLTSAPCWLVGGCAGVSGRPDVSEALPFVVLQQLCSTCPRDHIPKWRGGRSGGGVPSLSWLFSCLCIVLVFTCLALACLQWGHVNMWKTNTLSNLVCEWKTLLASVWTLTLTRMCPVSNRTHHSYTHSVDTNANTHTHYTIKHTTQYTLTAW